MKLAARSTLLLVAALAFAQTAPRPAADLLNEARQQAAGHRAVFAIFHASWCGWCHKLDSFLESDDIKPIFQKYFVTVHFTVQEHADKTSLNTPGGDEMMKQLGGPAGLPYFAFLSSDGAMLVNSLEPAHDTVKGGNIGFPDAPHEVDWFMEMLSKAAPQMSADEKTVIEKGLRKPKKQAE